MNSTVAVDEKWGIGKDGGLLACLPEDTKYSKEVTRGRTVVMGRRALESFPGGKPLKSRMNMVLSRDEAYAPEGIRIYHSVEDVLEVLRDYREEDMFTIGGGMMYREFPSYCSKAYVTCIHRAFDVDAAFENLDQDENWKLELVSDDRKHEGISFEFRVYRGVK